MFDRSVKRQVTCVSKDSVFCFFFLISLEIRRYISSLSEANTNGSCLLVAVNTYGGQLQRHADVVARMRNNDLQARIGERERVKTEEGERERVETEAKDQRKNK